MASREGLGPQASGRRRRRTDVSQGLFLALVGSWLVPKAGGFGCGVAA